MTTFQNMKYPVVGAIVALSMHVSCGAQGVPKYGQKVETPNASFEVMDVKWHEGSSLTIAPGTSGTAKEGHTFLLVRTLITPTKATPQPEKPDFQASMLIRAGRWSKTGYLFASPCVFVRPDGSEDDLPNAAVLDTDDAGKIEYPDGYSPWITMKSPKGGLMSQTNFFAAGKGSEVTLVFEVPTATKSATIRFEKDAEVEVTLPNAP